MLTTWKLFSTKTGFTIFEVGVAGSSGSSGSLLVGSTGSEVVALFGFGVGWIGIGGFAFTRPAVLLAFFT